MSKAIKNSFEGAGVDCSVRSFHNAQALYQAATTKYFDLLFLDIEIGEDSGIDLANRVRDELNNNKSLIVFVSSHRGYHDEGELYGAAPIRFISKPLNDGEIDHVTQIVMKRLLKPTTPDDYFSYAFKMDKVRRQAVEPYFVQIHCSFLVNILHLESYDVKHVHMKNGAVLPISTRQARNPIADGASQFIRTKAKQPCGIA